MFHRRRGFQVVLPLLARILGLERRPFCVFFTPQRFDTAAKTPSRPTMHAPAVISRTLTAIKALQR